jgi:CHAD domain-containing protein
VKPEPVHLHGVTDGIGLAARVLDTRVREVRRLAGGLQQRDQQGLHDFRIACKRVRYALERFADLDPSLETMAKHFALLQNALGEAHDRDVLLSILPASMGETERRLAGERKAWVDRAVVLWAQAQQLLLDCPLIVLKAASNHS